MTVENYYDDEKYFHKSNRDQSHDPKGKTVHWCNYCDRDMVHSGEKCGTCGKRDSSNRRKK